MVKQLTQRIHPASQIEPSAHSQEFLDLLDAKLNRNVVAAIVDHVVDAVDYAFSRPGPSASPKERRGRTSTRSSSPFSAFATRVLVNAEVKMPVVLTALAYIERARPHLQIALEEWACERVFLGALIVASKYTNDSTLKNVHWAYCTGVFGKSDVGRIEREFLDVLAFELSITEDDLAPFYDELAIAARVGERRRAAATTSVTTTTTPVTLSRASSTSSSATRSDDASAVPALSPSSSPGGTSSSASSSGPASPRTPPQQPAAQTPATTGPARTSKQPPTKAKRHSPLDLLRAAIPIPYHSHRSRESTAVCAA